MSAAEARSGLQQIILLDGHIQNVMTRLDVSDHATLIGTNGAGKTTLLKLLPLFYGIAPGALESRASGKKNFLDWYLPRPSSAIVFEYRREDSLCCAVVYRHPSGTKPAYRFLRAPFSEAAFSRSQPGQGLGFGREYLLGKELGRHWRAMELECSTQIEVVTDYRAVIQRDRSLLGQSGKARELRGLASRYGLGSSRTHMQHVEKVVHALVGRQGNMEKIKLMLAAIMRDEGVNVPRLPAHQSNERAIGDITGLRQLKRELPKLRQTLTANSELLTLEMALLGIGAGLQKHREDGNETITNQEAQRRELLAKAEQQASDWQVQRDELNGKLSAHKADVTVHDDSIAALDKQRDAWEAQDMESWSERLRTLPALEENLSDANGRYQGLLGQRDEMEREFEQRRSRIKDSLNRELQRIAARRNEVQLQRTELSERFRTRGETLLAKYRVQAETLAQRQADSRETLLEQRAVRQTELKSSGYSAVETERLQERQQEIDVADQRLQSLRETRQQAAEEQRALQQQLDIERAAEDRARGQYQAKRAAFDAMERLCYPPEKTLLSVLRQQYPGWVSNIGKVIDPQLLQRTDLAPLPPLAEDEAASFYGLGLALERIDTPAFAGTEDQLQAQLQAAAADKDNARIQSEQAAQQLQRQHEQVETADTALSVAEHQQHAEERRLQAARDALQALKAECNEALAERKLQAKQRLDEVEQQLERLKAEAGQEREQLSERERQAQMDIKAELANENSILDERDAGITEQEGECKTGGKSKLKQVNDDLVAALKDDGVDEKFLAKVRRDVESAKQAVADLRSRRERIAEYAGWRERQWPRRAGLFRQLEEAQQLLESAESELRRGESRFKAQRQALQEEQGQLEQALRRNREQLEALAAVSKRMATFDALTLKLSKSYSIAAAPARADGVDALRHEAEAALQERDGLLRQLQNGVNAAEGIISRSGGGIAGAWLTHRTELAQQTGMDADDGDFWRFLPRVLAALVDEAIPTAERALVDTLLAIGGQVNHFYIGLAAVKGKIDEESRRISRSIEQTLCVTQLQDIRVRLSSKVETLEYWPDLARFHALWREWQAGGSRDLPPENCTDSLDSVLKALRGSRITGEVESLFDLEITLTENGRRATVRNDRDLQEVSSTGLSFLALCSIFIGLTRLLCVDRQVAIHWPLDELGTLAPENVTLLFKMLSDNGIVILGGFPSNDLDLLKHFSHRYTIDRQRGLVEVALERDELADALDSSEAA